MAGTFWTSFVDGLALEGLLGDLRMPGAPTRMFKPEFDAVGEAILVLRGKSGTKLTDQQREYVLELVKMVLAESETARKLSGLEVEVAVPDKAAERYVVR